MNIRKVWIVPPTPHTSASEKDRVNPPSRSITPATQQPDRNKKITRDKQIIVADFNEKKIDPWDLSHCG